MKQEDIISSGLLELYVSGIASPQEEALVLQWVEEFPEVREELKEIEEIMEQYAMIEGIAPNERVKARLQERLQLKGTADTDDSAAVLPMLNRWKSIAAAAILLLAGSAIINFVYINKLKQERLANASAQQELLLAKQQFDDVNKEMEIVHNRYSQAVSLAGLEAAPEATAKIFWIKNSGEIYLDPTHLPAAPTGKQYQLWGIVNGQPVDAGLIIPTGNGTVRLQKMKSFGRVKVEAFAVTLEDAGGSATPKGKMYVMGKM
ncbi:MAG: anti-sigma factor [Chitinophagaceae bacterium]|nr:MAG: anti-sigma factor [Chitinophagaceae bacterium]